MTSELSRLIAYHEDAELLVDLHYARTTLWAWRVFGLFLILAGVATTDFPSDAGPYRVWTVSLAGDAA